MKLLASVLVMITGFVALNGCTNSTDKGVGGFLSNSGRQTTAQIQESVSTLNGVPVVGSVSSTIAAILGTILTIDMAWAKIKPDNTAVPATANVGKQNVGVPSV